MTKNAREITVDVLNRVLYQGAFSNLALDHAFSSAALKEEDTGLVTELTYGTLKHLLTLDKILEANVSLPLKKIERSVLNILRISIYQMTYLDRIPPYAVINEAVNLTKKLAPKASGFVNGVLRGYLRRKDVPLTYTSLEEELSVSYSFPLWMVKLFQEQYGESAEAILAGLNERPAITYRVNTLKMTREEALDILLKEGYNATPTKISPYGIEVLGGRDVQRNVLFQQGVLTVQDESSMLVAPALVEEKASRYLDLCAAPGGKTTHLAELTGDQKDIRAFDLYDSKIRLITQNIQRLGLSSITAKKQDATVFQKELAGSAQVLLDAPCSGLGIIRKKPEIKYTKGLDELESLVALQRELLLVVKDYVLPGGLLVYSTCTLNRAENEDNVRWFLEQDPDFEAEPLSLPSDPRLLVTAEGFVTVLPGQTMDGFFIARLRRKTI